jgi:methylated-DNA-[protein]-cysteine S-methyltransferase
MNKIKNNQLEYPSTLWINSIDDTPLGTIWIAISEKGLAAVEMGDPDPIFRQAFVTGISIIPENNRTCVYLHQLNEYLQGKRRQFDFAIDWSVLRSFQALALRATFEIPYGKTASYGEIAAHIGNPRAARAVGRAEATNPMPLVIPCHRVIAANGELGGYGGKGEEGLRKKRWLLDLEKNS